MKKVLPDLSSCWSGFVFKYPLKSTVNVLFACLIALPSMAGSINDHAANPAIDKYSGHFDLTISGKIVDDKGTPVKGASITERGANG